MRRYRGFTYIEVLIASTIFAATFGLIIGLLLNSLQLRQNAHILSEALQLAKSKMDTIKHLREVTSEIGVFEENADFTFSYDITKEEKDFIEEALDLLSEDVLETFSREEEKKVDGESSLITNIPLWAYKVQVFYKEELAYSLMFYRIRI